MQYRDENHIFACWSARQEERYLAGMAAKGWHLYEVKGRTYRFFEAEPAELRFATEYTGNEIDVPDVLAQQVNRGWEYIGRFGKKRYYAAPAGLTALHPSACSLAESEMLRSVQSNLITVFLLNLPGTFFCLLRMMITLNDGMLDNLFFSGEGWLDVTGSVIGVAAAIYLIRSVWRLRLRLRQLDPDREEAKQ